MPKVLFKITQNTKISAGRDVGGWEPWALLVGKYNGAPAMGNRPGIPQTIREPSGDPRNPSSAHPPKRTGNEDANGDLDSRVHNSITRDSQALRATCVSISGRTDKPHVVSPWTEMCVSLEAKGCRCYNLDETQPSCLVRRASRRKTALCGSTSVRSPEPSHPQGQSRRVGARGWGGWGGSGQGVLGTEFQFGEDEKVPEAGGGDDRATRAPL